MMLFIRPKVRARIRSAHENLGIWEKVAIIFPSGIKHGF